MRNSALIGIVCVAILGPTADKLPAQFEEFAYEAATRRVHQMISQIADVKTATARSEVFDRFVVSRDEYLAFAPVLQARLLVNDIDETSDLERKAAVVGRVLSWGHIPCWGVSGNSPAFQEYCRYFTHTDPRVKAIAFAFASQTLCASYDELGPTFAGCRDSSPMVRSAAFQMLVRQLEHMWGESSARSMAIDLVIAAFQSDRRVSRKPLYDCARQLGPSLRIIADDLFQGMYDEVNGDAAADALARIDGRAPMVRRVVAALQVRSTLR